jgi:hypothetical protein
LVLATANAHRAVASYLLDRGADPNAAAAGWNALHQTIHSRRPNLGYTPGPVPTGSVDSIEVVRKLVARGIDIDARMAKNGMKDGQRNRHNRLGDRLSAGGQTCRPRGDEGARGGRRRPEDARGGRQQTAARWRGTNISR